MGCCFNLSISQIYDLKGSRHNRYVVNTGKQGEVLLDENLTEGECSFRRQR